MEEYVLSYMYRLWVEERDDGKFRSLRARNCGETKERNPEINGKAGHAPQLFKVQTNQHPFTASSQTKLPKHTPSCRVSVRASDSASWSNGSGARRGHGQYPRINEI